MPETTNPGKDTGHHLSAPGGKDKEPEVKSEVLKTKPKATRSAGPLSERVYQVVVTGDDDYHEQCLLNLSEMGHVAVGTNPGQAPNRKKTHDAYGNPYDPNASQTEATHDAYGNPYDPKKYRRT